MTAVSFRLAPTRAVCDDCGRWQTGDDLEFVVRPYVDDSTLKFKSAYVCADAGPCQRRAARRRQQEAARVENADGLLGAITGLSRRARRDV